MLELLKSLIKSQSTPDKGEIGVAQTLGGYLRSAGLDVEIDVWDQTRANVIARLKGNGAGRSVIFLSHLDTVSPGRVGWKYPPFEAVESDGRIYGRGSCDMKGGLAASAVAAAQIAALGRKLGSELLFVATAGEETDSCGARRFVEKYGDSLKNCTGAILPEPTDFDVVVAHRGICWLKVVVHGKTAHGSMPHLGVNAIENMIRFIDEFKKLDFAGTKHDLLGAGSVSINKISGGQATNVVPDRCGLEIDIRTVPGQSREDIVASVRRIFEKLRVENPEFSADVEIIRGVDAMVTDPKCGFVRSICSTVSAIPKVVGFTTDGPYLAGLGMPVVVFGPGKSDICHKSDEYIEIADFQKAVRLYKTLIESF